MIVDVSRERSSDPLELAVTVRSESSFYEGRASFRKGKIGERGLTQLHGLAWTRAVAKGYDDALFVTETGEVRECTSANIFMVAGGRLRFPPRTESVLHGITQGLILDCAATLGIAADEQSINVDTLRQADEVFMSGTTVEALGITSIDDRPIGDGKVGPITRRLYDAFIERSHSGKDDAANEAGAPG